MWTKRGWADPKLSEADLEGDGIEIFGGVVRDVLISGNIIRGMASGLSLGHAEHLDDIMFRGNQVIDCARWGVVVNTKAALSVQVEDNVFDLDPFNRSRNRGPHGTWLKPAGPTGIQQQDGAGMLVRRNVFRNLARLGSGAMQGGGYWWDDNVIEADPVGYGFDPRNEGVGEVLSDGNSRLVQIGSDPADAQHFGRILSVPSFVATTRPTAGAWLPGAFVRAERPAVSAGRVLLGWLRLTIGAANGPADWTDVYGSAK
jgi:hypothetical protein